MRSAIILGVRDMQVHEVEPPTLAEGELLVQVKACGVCPGDVRAWALGSHPGHDLPFNPGHEATGIVVAAGSATDEHWLGTRVFADGPGGYADLKIVTRWSLERSGGPTRLPDNLSFEDGVFIEPLADCLYAAEVSARIHESRTALVIGCGQMGLQIVRVCVLAGLRVLACDPIARRRDLALQFGAASVVASASDLLAAVRDLAGPAQSDCVFLSCADPSVLPDALSCLGRAGRCVIFSAYENSTLSTLDLSLIHRNRLEIVGARWIAGSGEPTFNRYDRAARLLATGLVDTHSLVDRVVGLERIDSAFEAFRSGEIVKAVVTL